jgi:cellulose synthase/poly-beta-1,6-N-acetylglucosamine synthase-like glycosyltransferase
MLQLLDFLSIFKLFLDPIFDVLLVLFLITNIGYPLTLLLHRKHNKFVNDPNFTPPVTVVTAAHNEASIIAKKVENLFESNYPIENLKMIIVDDASSDGTFSIAKSLQTRYPNLRTLTKSRGGESAALNAGLEIVDTDIVVTSDADVLFSKDSIRNGVKWLVDPKVGGVTGPVVWRSKGAKTNMEIANMRVAEGLKRLESKVDSTTFNGGFEMFRRDLINRFPEEVFEDDSGGIMIRTRGKHVVFEPKALVFSWGPRTLKGLAKRRVRNFIGVMWTLRFYRWVLFNRKVGFFGLVTFPWKYLVPMLESVLFLILISWTVFDLFRLSLYSSFATYLLIILLTSLLSLLQTRPTQKLRGYLQIFAILCLKNLLRIIGLFRFLRGARVTVYQPGGETRRTLEEMGKLSSESGAS